MDEACASIRTEIDSMPAELDQVTRKVMRLEIEETALRKEKDKASRDRLKTLRKELGDAKSEADAMRARWEAEKNAIQKVRELRGKIEQARREAEESERQYDLEKTAKLRHGVLPQLARELEEQEKVMARREAKSLLREEVSEEEIAEVVSRWTGIPLARLVEGEREKLLRLDSVLHERVIGQDEACGRWPTLS